MNKPRHRLATELRLAAGETVVLSGNPAHYLSQVLRLKPGDAVALFSRAEGEWRAVITDITKREMLLRVGECLRPPSERGNFNLTVCFAPIKGGRLETMIEKATELGASVLQPVITRRTIVDKVNLVRAEAIAREAAEQCERIDWPEIRAPLSLEKLLGSWPADLPLIYGDETGGGVSITEIFNQEARPHPIGGACVAEGDAAWLAGVSEAKGTRSPYIIKNWGILVGPEGGFAPEELALLAKLPHAKAVGLGPRILRADTALITLCAATLMAWGDWHQPPRFSGEE